MRGLNKMPWSVMSWQNRLSTVADFLIHVVLVVKMIRYLVAGNDPMFGLFAIATAAWFVSTSVAQRETIIEGRAHKRETP